MKQQSPWQVAFTIVYAMVVAAYIYHVIMCRKHYWKVDRHTARLENEQDFIIEKISQLEGEIATIKSKRVKKISK